MSLRTLLIIVGVVIVVAVYFISARKRQRDSRVTFDRRYGRMELPDVILDHDDQATAGTDEWEVVSKAPALIEPRLTLPEDVVLPPQDEVLDELPAVRNDVIQAPEPSNARRKTDQLDLFGAPEVAPASRAPTRATAGSPPPDDGLITLYVRAREGQAFPGPGLVKAFNAVGMQHGDMAIFHHFGAGDLKCASAVFSAANMFEPGTFNLGKIEAFRTAGVALFLQLPGPLDGPVAFELLLNTAQRLTELVGGELYASPQARLDTKSIARLRARAARYTHARS